MASDSTKGIVLLSIQPRFARLIMTGEKKIEFRKVKFREQVARIVVYASDPVQSILGYFEVSHIDEDLPPRLWGRYHTVGRILREEFESYYASSARGIAIGVGKVHVLDNPIPLSELDESLIAPQSFSYLTDGIFKSLQQYV